ncbi:septum site-determining protein Ssd [Wenjunlia tyrosinilytica]|uniref:Septum formation initiator n=1 Tax=Wenjunlia tyrosinilytica TaxID=1544741 RepID=A0A918DXI6_9ACTN|nr:septum site-determining protein Ssd [Wenjunlia tyrosinilytica]GGO89301.1 septum formation initiator [Wenjunlia tyrosinilytica]
MAWNTAGNAAGNTAGSAAGKRHREAREPERITAERGGVAAPLIVTEDDALLDDLLRLCAAAGAEPEVAYGAPPGRVSWERAPLVLVGDDSAARMLTTATAGGTPRREGVLLIGRDLDDHDVWRRAVDIGADHVLFLPDGESWLVDRIADAAEGVGRRALTIGVLGGRGGAGASTLACALAVTAARGGQRTVLVDGDPLGGGLDVLLGGERTGGLRWPDLADSHGRVNGAALEESLPRLHDLSVLSWDRSDAVTISPEAVRSVLGAARRRGGVVVVDLPRRVDEAAAEALAQLDVGLLVVPSELRAVAAAKRVASTVVMVLRDLRVVVRGPVASGLDDAEIARLLRLRLAGELPPEPGLAGAQAGGDPPGSSTRGPLSRFCSAFLTEALPATGGSVAA